MPIFEILQSLMSQRDLTIADVSRVCGLPDSTVRGIITRKQKSVALEVAFKLSRGLNVSLEYLNGDEKTHAPPRADACVDDELKRITDIWQKLNDDGRAQLVEQAEQISCVPKYQAGRQTDTVSA